MIASYGRLLTAVCALASTAAAVAPLEVKGKDFVNSKTNDRFQIIGVDYQPGGESGFSSKNDPLSNGDICLRDAALMQRLGLNTIRVYNLDPNLNHDKCASIFNAAGIYMILDVNSPLSNGALNRGKPWTSYNDKYYEQVFGVIEAFKTFNNVLGFFAGNEVINEDATYSTPKYVRAVVRDMKEYISKHADRDIPVGYSAADVRDILMDTANYFECELKNSTSSRADFFGLNSYSWCGDSNFEKSGYDTLTEDFSNATLPIFFSEYGCNKVKPRKFTEVQALYGKEMTQAFSGGLVYEWTEEDNKYGIIKAEKDGSVKTLVDYDNFRSELNKLDMKQVMASNGTQTSVKPKTCSPDIIVDKKFYNAWDLPEAPSKVSDMINKGLSDAPSGKWVKVEATTIPNKVIDKDGKTISDVKFEILSTDTSNSPSTRSGTSSSSSESSSNAAVPNGPPSLALGGVGGLFMLLASLL
ncbi:hypothetical protein NUU61_004628 [Penicillium alfredii]|uniref:1,3-beta-glucanosyltransferase n=1 Tax=Penicillium alfredii TaxID=1506179 RepID=A0A9W9KE06_9EURO|nr:uncharacterized protein NUU61_004628 [Penicillium alfredii]KAJ5102406.1 hypothetical protein NUU61_004628 [Penicillium alfredii]